ncbi:ATP phosphoribosyltransferase [Bacillus cereus]|uniref:ATP phosphoribosyltransferase n=1 Tax=Bacillus cereus TaxID=1396 RepID=UPI000B4BF47B|nr:ATP phosphoribosyltransferase [Bacillus cereus]
MPFYNELLTIALSKGRLLSETLRVLQSKGIEISDYSIDSRKLCFEINEKKLRFILVKPVDVLLWIEKGFADLGIVGNDLLLEKGKDFVELFDLGIGKCKICICVKPGVNIKDVKSVASKYPNITKKFFDKQAQHIDIIHLNSSVEVAPMLNIADCIVEIVQSGKTLEENGLMIYDTIEEISTKIIKKQKYSYEKEVQINEFLTNLKNDSYKNKISFSV